MSQVTFKNQCIAVGRNGISKQIGIYIYPEQRLNVDNESFELIELVPVNSYGDLTNCMIQIDMDSIPEVIKQLQYFYDNFRKTTKVQGQSISESK